MKCLNHKIGLLKREAFRARCASRITNSLTVRTSAAMLCLFLLPFLLTGCNKANNDQIEQDLTSTLNAIREGTVSNETYIYSSDFASENAEIHAVSQKIMNCVSFEISSIESEDDSATANIKLTSPDTYQILTTAASSMQSEDVNLLLDMVSMQLDEDYPIKEFEVTVELKRLNDNWYLVPNGQLSDALTGGLMEQYSKMGQDIVNEFLGGVQDE